MIALNISHFELTVQVYHTIDFIIVLVLQIYMDSACHSYAEYPQKYKFWTQKRPYIADVDLFGGYNM